MKNLIIKQKGVEEVYKTILRWAEVNEMALVNNHRGEDNFLLEFQKEYHPKVKFSWGLAIFLFFLGIVIAAIGGANSGASADPEASTSLLVMMLLPLFIYLISYFLKKKPRTVAFKFSAREEGGEVLLKVDVSPQQSEEAKSELTHILNSLI